LLIISVLVVVFVWRLSGCLLWRPEHGEADKQLVLQEKERCLEQPELLARGKLPGEQR
jgi:hypothetical protein